MRKSIVVATALVAVGYLVHQKRNHVRRRSTTHPSGESIATWAPTKSLYGYERAYGHFLVDGVKIPIDQVKLELVRSDEPELVDPTIWQNLGQTISGTLETIWVNEAWMQEVYDRFFPSRRAMTVITDPTPAQIEEHVNSAYRAGWPTLETIAKKAVVQGPKETDVAWLSRKAQFKVGYEKFMKQMIVDALAEGKYESQILRIAPLAAEDLNSALWLLGYQDKPEVGLFSKPTSDFPSPTSPE